MLKMLWCDGDRRKVLVTLKVYFELSGSLPLAMQLLELALGSVKFEKTKTMLQAGHFDGVERSDEARDGIDEVDSSSTRYEVLSS